MIITNILLIAHLTGAFVIGFFILKAVTDILRNQSASYRTSSMQIAVGAGYQLITGSLLAMNINTSQSLLAFCSKMSLYIGIVFFVEALLFYRMENNQSKMIPARIAVSSLSIGTLFTLFTIIHVYGNI